MLKMLHAGMNVLRVNCAHEGEREWGQMLLALAEARRETGKECRVLMDLAGPKIRTGAIAGARHIATWKPTRDEIGNPTAPERVVIRRPDALATAPVPVLGDESFESAQGRRAARDARAEGAMAIQAVERDEIVGLATERATPGQARAQPERAGARPSWRSRSEGSASIDVRVGDTSCSPRATSRGSRRSAITKAAS
jgi:hypothetical protein